jgi:hypothetical protein
LRCIRLLALGALLLWAAPARADVDPKFDYKNKKRDLKICLQSSAGCPANMADSLQAAINLWKAKLKSWKLSYTTDCSTADIKVNCKSLKGLGRWQNSSGTYGASTGSEVTINKDADWGWCNDKHELVDALVHEIGHAIRLDDNRKPADSMNGSRSKTGHKRAPGVRDSTEAATSDTSTVNSVVTVPPGGKKLSPFTVRVSPSPDSAPFNLPAALAYSVQAYRPAWLQILSWVALGPDQIEVNGFIGPDADGVEAFFVVITYPESTVVRQGFLHVAEDPAWDPLWRPTAIAPPDTLVPGPSSLIILDAGRSIHPGGFDSMRFSWFIDGQDQVVKGQWETAITLPAGEHDIVLKALDEMGYESEDHMHVTVGPGSDVRPLPRGGNYLERNVPNPFNPRTTIRYGIASASHVLLRVYDVAGRPVRTLVDAVQPAADHSVDWDGRNEDGEEVPAGVYVYRIVAGSFTETQQMVLVK